MRGLAEMSCSYTPLPVEEECHRSDAQNVRSRPPMSVTRPFSLILAPVVSLASSASVRPPHIAMTTPAEIACGNAADIKEPR